jgi:hypothetical protein
MSENGPDNVASSALELLELSKLDSPYTRQLLRNYRKKLINRLLTSNKIDQQTADILQS